MSLRSSFLFWLVQVTSATTGDTMAPKQRVGDTSSSTTSVSLVCKQKGALTRSRGDLRKLLWLHNHALARGALQAAKLQDWQKYLAATDYRYYEGSKEVRVFLLRMPTGQSISSSVRCVHMKSLSLQNPPSTEGQY